MKWFTDSEYQSFAIRRCRFAKPFVLVACLLLVLEGSIRCGLAQQPTGPPQEGEVRVTAPLNWPQFRGPNATGVADGQHPPSTWDVKAGTNVRWKTPIPGLGHSCPVVWGDRVFLTTAVEGDVVPGAKAVPHTIDNTPFVHPDAVGADRRQTLKVVALDADSGRLLWERTAWEGTPFDSRP